jgi:hypothetical protein
VPVSVGGEWTLTSDYTTAGPMQLRQTQSASFSIVDGTRIIGEGQTVVSVRGTCTVLDHIAPLRIGGAVRDDRLHLTLEHPPADTEPVPHFLYPDSIGCMMRGAIESLMLTGEVLGFIGMSMNCPGLEFSAVDAAEQRYRCPGTERLHFTIRRGP